MAKLLCGHINDQAHPIGGTGAHVTSVQTAQVHSPIQFC